MAAQMGHSEVVKVLLLRGADRDADRKVCYFILLKNKNTTFSPYLFIFCRGLNQTVQPGGKEKKLIKMHEMFDKGLVCCILSGVSDWRTAPRLCSRPHIKATVTSSRSCSSSLLHSAFWRYDSIIWRPNLPESGSVVTVCVLSCNLERFYSSSCRRHGRESKNCPTSAEGRCWSSFTQQGEFETCGL